MKLEELKQLVLAVEPRLADDAFQVVHAFERDGRRLHVAITERLRSRAHKARLWCSKPFLITLKNAAYGFDNTRARSRGGCDGLFLLDRDYRPRNEMMTKIFDGFLDRADGGAEPIARRLGVDVDELLAVRLVSHHMRLLGVLSRTEHDDWLVLVDFDATK